MKNKNYLFMNIIIQKDVYNIIIKSGSNVGSKKLSSYA